MVTTITIDKISEDIMGNLFTILKANVVSVITPNPSTGGNTTYTIQHWASPNNDILLKKEEDYPIGIVGVPNLPEDALTYRNMIIKGTVDISIHAQNSRATIQFKDLISKAIRDNKEALRSVGLENIKITGEDADFFDRQGFKDHWATVTYSFEYEYIDGN